MSQYLENFGDARKIVLPCLYLPPGIPQAGLSNKKKTDAADNLAKKLSRKMMRVNQHPCHLSNVPSKKPAKTCA